MNSTSIIWAVEMCKLFRMDRRLRIEDRFVKVQRNLFEYLEKHRLYEIMPREMELGSWRRGGEGLA